MAESESLNSLESVQTDEDERTAARERSNANLIPGGRPARLTRDIKQAVMDTFERLGGVEGFYNWASEKQRVCISKKGARKQYVTTRPNLGKFYEMVVGLAPKEIAGKLEHSGRVGHYIAVPVESRHPLTQVAHDAVQQITKENSALEPDFLSPPNEAGSHYSGDQSDPLP